MTSAARIFGSVPCKAFGQLHQQAPVARILGFFERNVEPQTLDHGQVDLMIPKQQAGTFEPARADVRLDRP